MEKNISLIGEYAATITEKNRVVIPAPLRADHDDVFYVSTEIKGILEVYDRTYWEYLLEEIKHLPRFHSLREDFTRLIFSQTTTIKIDPQGRFVLNQKMLENLLLSDGETEIIIIGAGDRIEYWSKKRWEEKKDSLIENRVSLVNNLALLAKHHTRK